MMVNEKKFKDFVKERIESYECILDLLNNEKDELSSRILKIEYILTDLRKNLK